MQSYQKQEPLVQKKCFDEQILVVKRSILFSDIHSWHGILSNFFNQYIGVIQQHAEYIPRSLAETNFEFKQIIPYVLFVHDHKLFVMQRKSTASEQRLANKYSLGIGGHIRQEDIINNDITSWAQREFDEEVMYQGSLQSINIGILNDDSTEVGKVHLGMILLMKGSSPNISIKAEHKSGMLLTFDECMTLYPNMENWSKICLDYLFCNKRLLY